MALLGRADQIADLRSGGARDAIDGRSEFGEAEIDFRGFDGGGGGGDAGLRGFDRALLRSPPEPSRRPPAPSSIDWSVWRYRNPAA